MNDRTKEREEEDEKVISGAPQNKDRKGRPLAGEAAPVDPRADAYGTRHLMEEEMKKSAAKEGASKPDQGLPGSGEEGEKPESDLKPDQTLPEEPLPGKPPEPPLGGSRGGPGNRRR